MSRIDEALKRNRSVALTSAQPDVPRQELFAAAWPAEAAVGGESSDATGPGRSATTTLADLPPVESRVSIGFSSEWRELLAGGPEGDPGLLEQFRRLAATLHHAHRTSGLRSVMITSAAPGDGKTLTAVNLALVLAESYRYNVLLVDADLRRPSISRVVQLSDDSGLSEALRSHTEQKLALVSITPRLTLLPAGQPIANSIEALTSPRMQRILGEATQTFDWVVIDAPPVGPTADARLLTQMVGGTLFVVHAGQTPYPEVQKAIDAIGREHILGVVLNGVELSANDYQYYGVAPK